MAQRSAEAAKEIKTSISASSKQVAEGVQLVDQTGKALDQIVTQVSEMTSIVGDIAASTQEQAAALHQVNTAIEDGSGDPAERCHGGGVDRGQSQPFTGDGRPCPDRGDVPGGPGQTGPGGRASGPEASLAIGSRARFAMKTVGRRGAAAKPEASSQDESWTEF